MRHNTNMEKVLAHFKRHIETHPLSVLEKKARHIQFFELIHPICIHKTEYSTEIKSMLEKYGTVTVDTLDDRVIIAVILTHVKELTEHAISDYKNEIDTHTMLYSYKLPAVRTAFKNILHDIQKQMAIELNADIITFTPVFNNMNEPATTSRKITYYRDGCAPDDKIIPMPTRKK